MTSLTPLRFPSRLRVSPANCNATRITMTATLKQRTAHTSAVQNSHPRTPVRGSPNRKPKTENRPHLLCLSSELSRAAAGMVGAGRNQSVHCAAATGMPRLQPPPPNTQHCRRIMASSPGTSHITDAAAADARNTRPRNPRPECRRRAVRERPGGDENAQSPRLLPPAATALP